MRRALTATALLTLVLGGPAAAGAATASQPRAADGALLLVLPLQEARSFIADRPAAVAFGVYPPSRAAGDLIAELGTGAPPRRDGETGGASGVVAALLDGRASGAVVPAMRGTVAATVLDAFGVAAAGIEQAVRPPDDDHLAVVVLATDGDAEATLHLDPWTDNIYVLGVGEQTPLLFARTFSDGSDVILGGGQARRPGIATPYDITATLLDHVSVERDRLAGRILTPVAFGGPDRGDAIEASLRDPADIERPLTAATGLLGIAALLAATAAVLLRSRRFTAAFARGAAMIPAGYLGALFIESDRWEVRATSLAGAFVFGFTFIVRSPRRFVGWIFVLTSTAVIALTFFAAADPGGAVASDLWADPLTSWRFFGLRNHLASFAAGGVIVGVALLGVPWWGVLAATGGVAGVLGTATLGANFVGVLTLTFGAVIAVLGLIARRPRWWHVVPAAIAAIAATAASLAADAIGEPASHGGRAVQDIGDGGFAAARSIIADRLALSIEEVQALGPVGWLAVVLTVIALIMLSVWARSDRVPERVDRPGVRAAVAGGAAAALAALATEDSGLYTGAILGLFPWVAYLSARAEAGFIPPVPDPAAPPVPPAPPDDAVPATV